MNKKLLLISIIMLTACNNLKNNSNIVNTSSNISSSTSSVVKEKKDLDIIEEEITISIGESYQLTIYSSKDDEDNYSYSWLFIEGVKCVTIDYDGLVQGICPGRAVIKIVDNLNNQDKVVINVIKDENSKPFISNFAMYEHFYDYGNGKGETHRKFLKNNWASCDSVYINVEDSLMKLNYENYGIDYDSLIGGDTLRFTYYGNAYNTSLFPCGTLSFEGELLNVEYIPSEIHEITLVKEVDMDMINIGLISETLKDENIENNFVISIDEEGNYIRKALDKYDDQTTLYYSFNQGLENPHKYSFLYDFNPKS